MKFVVDAQLPRRLARELAASGHDAVHTLDFPAANRTQDKEIVALAIRENRIVVTKDLCRRRRGDESQTSWVLVRASSRRLLHLFTALSQTRSPSSIRSRESSG
jgi:uncharacterized protein with PIN domain